MKIIIIILNLLLITHQLESQVIKRPNFSTASHPMKVENIEISNKQTIITLSIENQSETGYFCADKNIYIIDAISKTKYKLIKSSDIPVCPDNHYFKTVGEVLQFQLFFPILKPGTKYINIIEDCRDNCFSIKGIVLDNDFNKQIDLGFDNYSRGYSELALSALKKAIEGHPDYPFGNLYENIIQIYAEKDDLPNAKIWYNTLSNSTIQDKTEVINRLKNYTYYSKLIF